MEELLAQLLLQRSAQTQTESEAKHGALVAQLQRAKRPKVKVDEGRTNDAGEPFMQHPVWPERKLPVHAGLNANTDEQMGWREEISGPPVDGDPDASPTYSDTKTPLKFERQFARGGMDHTPMPEDLIKTGAGFIDDQVQRTGWLPSDFQHGSWADAANLIGQQLRARRIRTLQEGDPEYIAGLPQI
jgi:hypothetical protein